MSILDQLLGSPQADRFAQGQADFSRHDTDDFSRWNELVGSAPPEHVEQAYARAAREVDEREYADHVTPGVGGTNPLGALGSGALGGLAAKLLGGIGGGGPVAGGGLGSMIPGLRNSDPNQMDEHDVARVADYMRRNHPEQFARVASQVGREQPSMLQGLLGNKMLMLAAAGLVGNMLTKGKGRGGF